MAGENYLVLAWAAVPVVGLAAVYPSRITLLAAALWLAGLSVPAVRGLWTEVLPRIRQDVGRLVPEGA